MQRPCTRAAPGEREVGGEVRKRTVLLEWWKTMTGTGGQARLRGGGREVSGEVWKRIGLTRRCGATQGTEKEEESGGRAKLWERGRG
ncbi:hypothetical protein CRG98_018344 [Punica granatum]|uniref:Uncharacterized protein n=1 Tax=Punica granatum TaxID=22663 RepID=A0A2I0JZJ9_PUNGR|nr:hypothetical protein CRG98_018344 [Punica granatum]